MCRFKREEELPMLCEGCGGEMKEIGNEDDSAIICPNCDIWTQESIEKMIQEKYGNQPTPRR